MALHRRRTGKTVAIGPDPSPGTATDGFVILATGRASGGVAKAEIVHRALGRRLHAKGGEQGVGGGLGGLHIARHHGGRRPRIEQTAQRHDQADRFKAAGIERDLLCHQTAQHVEHHGLGNRQGGIAVAGLLG